MTLWKIYILFQTVNFATIRNSNTRGLRTKGSLIALKCGKSGSKGNFRRQIQWFNGIPEVVVSSFSPLWAPYHWHHAKTVLCGKTLVIIPSATGFFVVGERNVFFVPLFHVFLNLFYLDWFESQMLSWLHHFGQKDEMW